MVLQRHGDLLWAGVEDSKETLDRFLVLFFCMAAQQLATEVVEKWSKNVVFLGFQKGR